MFAAKYQRAPLLEITSQTEYKISFTLSQTDVSMANALRRIMLAEVPTLAIDLVTIKENTSVHQDEFLAHRLGLLPLDSRDIRKYQNKENCQCADFCAQCSPSYSLNVVCKEQQQQIVTHLDIIPNGANTPMPVPKLADLEKANQGKSTNLMGITIAKLRTNQQIEAELTAAKGIGKLHAKWNPTATAVFRYEPLIKIDSEIQKVVSADLKREILQSCPRDVFQLRASTRAQTQSTNDMNDFYMFGADDSTLAAGADVEDLDLEVANKMSCNFCRECNETCKAAGVPQFVVVSHVADRFHFTVESTGCMPAAQIVEMALEILGDKLKLVAEKFMSNPAAAAALGTAASSGNAQHSATSAGGMLDLH